MIAGTCMGLTGGAGDVCGHGANGFGYPQPVQG